MLKQANSSQEVKAKEFQEKFNKITTFMTKFIFQENFAMMKKSGYVDSYTSDATTHVMGVAGLGKVSKPLFLLFKSKTLRTQDLEIIIKSLAKIPVEVAFSYELVNNYRMIVLVFPEKFIEDYDKVIQGKYSSLSDAYKSGFPSTQESLNSKGQRMGMEYTLYHHIFNRTEWLQQFWKDRLGMFELDENLELWEQPDKKDLVFDVKNII